MTITQRVVKYLDRIAFGVVAAWVISQFVAKGLMSTFEERRRFLGDL